MAENNIAMKRRTKITTACLTALCSFACMLSCSEMIQYDNENAKGKIVLRFADGFDAETKAALNIPDTNNFILSVLDADGKSIYEGKYGAAPVSFLTKAGTYTVGVKSRTFSEPLFDAPQFGDNQIVTVNSGKTASVVLNCYQLNSGVKLTIDPAFPELYPGTQLYLKGSDGRLMYSYTEKRIAYFNPGTVSLVMEGKTQKTLFTRVLSPQQILSVRLSSEESAPGGDEPSQTSPGIKITVDTSRFWISENIVLGGSTPGGEVSSAYSVAQARELSGGEDVWVYGYIVGGDLSSSKCSFDAPFVSRSNLVIAGKSTCRNKDICLSVQLAKGDIRDALNLVDHEDLLGRQVFLRGDIVQSYYGIPGLQSLTAYQLR